MQVHFWYLLNSFKENIGGQTIGTKHVSKKNFAILSEILCDLSGKKLNLYFQLNQPKGAKT